MASGTEQLEMTTKPEDPWQVTPALGGTSNPCAPPVIDFHPIVAKTEGEKKERMRECEWEGEGEKKREKKKRKGGSGDNNADNNNVIINEYKR